MAPGALGGPAAAALQAYRVTSGQAVGSQAVGGLSATGGTDFGGMLQSALQGVVGAGHDAETKATQAISGQGNLLDVVSAVSKAELSLQTVTAVRDRVVQAYQDIMRMPI